MYVFRTLGGEGTYNLNGLFHEPTNVIRQINISNNSYVYETPLPVSMIFEYEFGVQIENVIYFSPNNCSGINYPSFCGNKNSYQRPFYKYDISTNEFNEMASIVHNGRHSGKCSLQYKNKWYIFSVGGMDSSDDYMDSVYVWYLFY